MAGSAAARRGNSRLPRTPIETCDNERHPLMLSCDLREARLSLAEDPELVEEVIEYFPAEDARHRGLPRKVPPCVEVTDDYGFIQTRP